MTKRFGFLVLVLAAGLLAAAARLALHGSEPTSRKVAPLSLDGLMDEKLPDAQPAPKKRRRKIRVDNGACYVCHDNLQEDELVVVHAQDAIGCVKCHGESAAHRNDEDNVTPPDRMFGRDAIESMCRECHTEHNASPYEILERWKERCSHIARLEDVICTDCHYQHRLPRRTVQWDRKTRNLLFRSREVENAVGGRG